MLVDIDFFTETNPDSGIAWIDFKRIALLLIIKRLSLSGPCYSWVTV